jgi:ribonuclease T1
MRRHAWLLIGLLLLGLWAWSQRDAPAPAVGAPAQPTASAHDPLPPGVTSTRARPTSSAHARYPDWLPVEALDTLALIERGGPYPHRQDGARFQNRERRLPSQPRGYYREFTVRTPGSRDRGARRIVSGGGGHDGSRPVEFFYTADHYRTFRRFAPPEPGP